MSLNLASYIVSLVVMIILGVFVFANNPRNRINISFFIFTLAACVWIFALAVADNTTSLSLVDFGARLAFVSSALTVLAVFVFTLALAYPGQSHNRHIVAVAMPAALLLLATPTHLAIQSVSVESYGAGVQGGIAYDLLSAYLVVCLLVSLYVLIRGIKRGKSKTRTQLLYFLTGLTLTGAGALLTNLVFVSVAFLGPPSYLFVAGFTAYAIVKHRLFNIRAIVARSVAYLLLLSSLVTLYAGALFTVTATFFEGSQITPIQNLAYIALAVLLAFTFQPLQRFFEHFTDKVFFRDNYDSRELINRFGKILVEEFELPKLMHKTLGEMCRTLKVANGQMYIFNEGTVYRVEHYGAIPQKLITGPHLRQLRRRILVTDELEGGTEKNIMDEFGYRLALHLRTKEEFVGYLLLGDKLSGDIYSPTDIEVLEILGQELAVAISNAKAYEEIEEFTVTLQDKVDHATTRLRSANRHLRELDEAKDEFISMASHQLRTPLTSIKGYISMLAEGDAGPLDKQQKEFLEYAYSGTNRMVSLISDLLNVSRMQAGRFMIERVPVDLAAVVAEEVSNLQTHAKPKGLKLEYRHPKKALPLVNIDENKTRQVIMNFVDNAIYYTKEGGVTVSLEKVGKQIELRVTDTGIGVPPAAQKKLFHKFFRADNAQTVRPDGTGLGLYLAKRVVEDQGGAIIFETEEGKGSTFGFSFPLAGMKVDTKKSPKGVARA